MSPRVLEELRHREIRLVPGGREREITELVVAFDGPAPSDPELAQTIGAWLAERYGPGRIHVVHRGTPYRGQMALEVHRELER